MIPIRYKRKFKILLAQAKEYADEWADALEGLVPDEEVRGMAANWIIHQFRSIVKHTNFNTKALNELVLKVIQRELSVPDWEPSWWDALIASFPD
jgi:hypothetical protein